MQQAFTHRHALVAGLALAAVTVIAGCRPNRAGAANRDGDVATDTMAARDTMAGNHNGDWSDSKIMRVVMTANSIDSAGGAFAAGMATSPAVKEFAQTMVRDHGAANKQGKTVMQRAQVADSMHVGGDDPAAKMQQRAIDQQGELRKLSGVEFDKAYIDGEVKMHQDVLDALDDELIPHAQNAAVKGYLEQIRPAVASHLERAKMLQDQLNNGATPAGTQRRQ
jgi:putative membrane protein